MVVGLDPVWDDEIYQIFPFAGGSLWFINEETLSEDSGLYHVTDARNGRTFIGENASYELFMGYLHRAFFSTSSHERNSMSSDNQTAPAREENVGKGTALDRGGKRNDSSEHSGSIATRKPLKLFISSVSQDDALLQALLAHMATLKREKIIDTWHSHKILAGQVIQAEIDDHLQSAALILLLVSADFLASDYIDGVELKWAMELHNAGKARVIPIIVRPCDWQGTALGSLKALPSNGKPVTRWTNRDDALLDIVQGIRDVVSALL